MSEIDEHIASAKGGKLRVIGESWFTKCYDTGGEFVLLNKPIMVYNRYERVAEINKLKHVGLPVAGVLGQKIECDAKRFEHICFNDPAYMGWELMDKIHGKTMYRDYVKILKARKNIDLGVEIKPTKDVAEFEKQFKGYENLIDGYLENAKMLSNIGAIKFNAFVKNAMYIIQNSQLQIDWSAENFMIDKRGFNFIDLEHHETVCDFHSADRLASRMTDLVFPRAPEIGVAAKIPFGAQRLLPIPLMPRETVNEINGLYAPVGETLNSALKNSNIDPYTTDFVVGATHAHEHLKTMQDVKNYIWDLCR
jgi:hypothetical protein